MKNYTIIFLTGLVLISCANSRYGIELSNFTIEGKKYNRCIENRVPDYREGHIHFYDQISLNLNRITHDTIIGHVMDSKTNDPLLYSIIQLRLKNNDKPITLSSDSLGNFYSGLENRVIEIRVTHRISNRRNYEKY